MTELQTVLQMTKGQGETSYAMNSQLQKTAISEAKPFVQKTVTDFYTKNLPKCLTIADLGCSSGPNTFAVIQEVIEAIACACEKLGHAPPEFTVVLNDLVGNDFNTLFKSIPSFVEKLKKEMGDDFGRCFISGMPGSFYGRLFPSETLHFVHSSNCLHWLSKVPPGIGNTGGNIYISKTSPPHVVKAYLTQFQKDFNLFLCSRSQEIVWRGRMVLTLIGRRSSDPASEQCCQIWELLAQSLRDLVSEGGVEKAKLDSFDMPLYYPSREELETVIQEQGSFNLDFLETFNLNWDPRRDLQNNSFVFDKRTSGRNVSNSIRPVVESIIVNHFGEEIVGNLFQKYAVYVGEHMAEEEGYYVNHVMCMTKKT